MAMILEKSGHKSCQPHWTLRYSENRKCQVEDDAEPAYLCLAWLVSRTTTSKILYFFVTSIILKEIVRHHRMINQIGCAE